ncbi:MAG: branched-chain amino acid ABC transporter permease [Actinomycetota bacterium]
MITSLWAGLATGSIYTLIAIGYNITLTTAGVLNFAYANIVMIGAFVAVSGLALGLPIWAIFILAALVGAIVATAEERVAVRFLPKGDHAELITTIGASTVLTGATALIWGNTALRVDLFPQVPLQLFGGSVQPNSIILIIAALVLGVGLHFFNTRTKFGLASLAHAFDRESTMLRGVNVRWLSIVAFAASGALGGLIGPLVGMTTTATPFIAITLAIKGFIALYCGGVGSQAGAIIGGFGIGIIEALANLWLGPNYGDFAVFAVFLAILLIRPQGIVGTRMLRSV